MQHRYCRKVMRRQAGAPDHVLDASRRCMVHELHAGKVERQEEVVGPVDGNARCLQQQGLGKWRDDAAFLGFGPRTPSAANQP